MISEAEFFSRAAGPKGRLSHLCFFLAGWPTFRF
jgi:hypothetical protein